VFFWWQWKDAPKEMYGKPVKYVKSTENLKELHKYYACVNHSLICC